MKKKLSGFITVSLIALAGCALFAGCSGGGGGSGVDDVPVYAGAWTGSVYLVGNSCPRTIPDEFQYLYLLHNVDQAAQKDASGNVSLEVVLNDGVDTFVGLGEVDQNGEGHKFSVTGSPHELPGFLAGYKCSETLDFSYEAIDFSTDSAGFVTRHSSITCTKPGSKTTCDVTYTGSSYRTSNPANEPERSSSSDNYDPGV